MILCSCTGATDRDVREDTARGREAGTRCGGCRAAVDEERGRLVLEAFRRLLGGMHPGPTRDRLKHATHGYLYGRR